MAHFGRSAATATPAARPGAVDLLPLQHRSPSSAFTSSAANPTGTPLPLPLSHPPPHPPPPPPPLLLLLTTSSSITAASRASNSTSGCPYSTQRASKTSSSRRNSGNSASWALALRQYWTSWFSWSSTCGRRRFCMSASIPVGICPRFFVSSLASVASRYLRFLD